MIAEQSGGIAQVTEFAGYMAVGIAMVWVLIAAIAIGILPLVVISHFIIRCADKKGPK